MLFSFLADLVVVLHFAFILFAVFGGLLCLWRRGISWVHIPIALWAALIEFFGWICPLTPLENWLRLRAGEEAYGVRFVERYLLPLIYPAVLTRRLQITLGCLVVILNLAVYLMLWFRTKRKRRAVDGRRFAK